MELFQGKPCSACPVHGLREVLLHEPQLLLADEAGRAFRDERALAGHGRDEALRLEVRIGPLRRDRRDPQVCRELPDGGELLSGRKVARHDLGTYPLCDLLVDGLPRAVRDQYVDHGPSPSLCYKCIYRIYTRISI